MTQDADREPVKPIPTDPELAALLEATERDGPPPDLGELYAGVRDRIRAADASPIERLRAQPTWRRRALGLATIAGVIGVMGLLRPRADLGTYPLHWLALYVASLGSLLAVCAVAALRPLHRPALSRGASFSLGALAVAATVVLAAAPGLHDHAMAPESMPVWAHATPCFFHGLFVATPLYVVLRLLDRGNAVGRVLAASAAGLAGNLVLELKCAAGGLAHLLAGHASVVLLFVLGIAAVELALEHRRPRRAPGMTK